MTGRPNGPGSVALVVATAATSWFTLSSWGGFVEGNSVYLLPLFFGIPFVSLAGYLARWARFPLLVVAAAQLLAVFLFVNLVYGTSPIPTGTSVTAATQAFVDSIDALSRYAAPIPATVRSVGPVLVLGGLVCHVVVDLLAVSLDRVPAAGLPLLVVYTLPVSILDQSVHWLAFVLGVTGFLLMLAVQEGGRITRWGRQFGPDPKDAERPVLGTTDARRHPLAIGATAVTAAVFLPLVIPTLGLGLFGGNGPGGAGDREVKITNPMTDLKRDLVMGKDVPLLQVRTKGPTPEYVRFTVLTNFTDQAWGPGKRDLPESQSADGSMPPPEGLSGSYPTSTSDWQVSITDNLKSLWLPTPMLVDTIRAGREWRYDSSTLDFHSAHDDINTAGLDYSLTRLIPRLTGNQLAEAPSPRPTIASAYTSLPSGMPDEVKRLAKEVTEGRQSDYEKAQALQEWFRGPEFTYSTTPDSGNGNDALVEFLHDKVGYCEQFSSAMAVMARILGIPARVAVGLHYDGQGDDSDAYEFSSHDLHAWPELYFEGAGWVIFEPTPSSHIPGVPSYTDDEVKDDRPTSAPSESDTANAPTSRAPKPEPTRAEDEQAGDRDDQDDSLSVVPFLWGGGGVLLLVAVAVAPRLLRRSRRIRRWQGDDPVEAAWAELRDLTTDLGRPWPDGRSPRATGRALLEFFGPAEGTDHAERPRTGVEVNPEATTALEALVDALERVRYAPDPQVPGQAEVRDLVETCEHALRGGATPRDRRRATWVPRSVLSGSPRVGRTGTTATRRVSSSQPLDQIS